MGKAINSLIAQGHTPRCAATIWIQGESDARTLEMADAYKPRLKILIDHFRQVILKDPGSIFLLGVDAQHPYCIKNPQVVTAQKQLAAEEVNTCFASMVLLEKADASHLTPAGLEAHGRRLAVAFNLVAEHVGQRSGTRPGPTGASCN